MKVTNIQIFLIRLAIGGLFLNMGLEKYHSGWLSSSQVSSRISSTLSSACNGDSVDVS